MQVLPVLTCHVLIVSLLLATFAEAVPSKGEKGDRYERRNFEGQSYG